MAELPWPHNPFRCAHHTLIKPLLKDEEDDDAPNVCGPILEGLSAEKVAACEYHLPNRKLAAEIAVRLHRNRVEPGTKAFEERARSEGAGDEELWAIRSLWSEPISWRHGQSCLTDGQHRVCGLKLAGATRTLIEAD